MSINDASINDIPTRSGFTDEAAEIEPDALPDCGARDDEARLDLLLPDMLPVELNLSGSERVMLRRVLTDLLHALQLPDHAASLARLEQILAGLPDAGGAPAPVGETGIPARAEQVDDFDAYFRVNRIASPQPAVALVRGLVQTARAVMSLFCRADHLPAARVEQQIAGFVTYTHVLARTFELGELS